MDTNVGMPAEQSAATKRYPVEFRGIAKEYFGIWIVNVLLTILTLGIYSAWAKVRRERYFRGNILIDGHAFDYHAKPLSLLWGRLIVVAILAVYGLAARLFPPVQLLALLFFVFGLPLVITRGLRFNARVSSYRNLRFDFVGKYWGAMKVFVLGTILAIVSLGILAPVVSRWSAQYVIGNTRYAARPFNGDWNLTDFYRAWLLPFLLVLGAALIIIGVPAGVFYAHPEYLVQLSMASSQDLMVVISIGLYLLVYALIIVYAIAGILYGAAVRNVVLNSAQLDGRVAFESTVGRGRYLWIAVSNLLVTAISLGLMRPWAAIRATRYLCVSTAVYSNENFDRYRDEMQREVGVGSSQFMEIEGFDVGVGI